MDQATQNTLPNDSPQLIRQVAQAAPPNDLVEIITRLRATGITNNTLQRLLAEYRLEVE